MNLIEQVVGPLKADAMNRAEQYAKETIADCREKLAANGNDLDKVAPYPSGFAADYFSKLAIYRLFQAITTWRKSSYSHHDPKLADIDSNKCQKFIKEAREHAAEQYDLFVAKLTKKIGPVTAAELKGNHIWGYSFLTVTTANGDKQIWKTQNIMNISKLGKPFPQWPSRKVKKEN